MAPTDCDANLRFREDLLTKAQDDEQLQADLRRMCKQDALFWVNTFAFTFDPVRWPNSPNRPMILWSHQEAAFRDVLEAIGSHDVVIEKNRDEGATWVCLILPFIWRWLFFPGQTFLLVSRNADYVDKKGNPKCLFWKIDHVLKNLPKWMLPANFNWRLHRTDAHLENPDFGTPSVIDGESTTGNVARGDRRTAVGVDEFAAFEIGDGFKAIGSLATVSNCRIYNSTHEGTGTAFYQVSQRQGIKKVRLMWMDNPYKNKGQYTTDAAGNVKLLDFYEWPKDSNGEIDYEFHLDGKLRSPWYDQACEDLAWLPSLIAAQLDANPRESVSRWFPEDLVQRVMQRDVRVPKLVAHVEIAGGRVTQLRPAKQGELRLWQLPDEKLRWPDSGHYCIGVDISAGTGTSNSVISILDTDTGELIGEYVNPRMRPEHLSVVAVAIGRWFNEAFMIWEENGLGNAFGRRVVELGYRRFYCRQNEQDLAGTITSIPGWWSTPPTRNIVFSELREGLMTGEIVLRSKEAAADLQEIQFNTTGGVCHAKALNRLDPSGAGANHADRVTAVAIAWHVARKGIRPVAEEVVREIPPGSIAWILKANQRAVAYAEGYVN